MNILATIDWLLFSKVSIFSTSQFFGVKKSPRMYMYIASNYNTLCF